MIILNCVLKSLSETVQLQGKWKTDASWRKKFPFTANSYGK